MNCTYLILNRTFYSVQNGLCRFLKLLPVKNYRVKGIRTLYGPSYLGLDGFIKINKSIQEEYGDTTTLLNRVESFVLEDKIIHVEDLKVLVACCVDDKNLTENTIKLSKRYFDQVKDLHNIVPYCFGPLLMRLLYIHESVDEALKLILDDEYGRFFTQISSYHVLMDKLFKAGRYEEVKFLMNKIITEKPFEIPVSCLTLTLAANYRIGTEDALEDSKKLIHLTTSTKKRIQFRPIAFAAALALKLEKPSIALEIIENSDSATHFLISNLKVLTLAKLGRIDDVIAIFKSRALNDVPKTAKQHERRAFCHDVFEEVEKIIMDVTLDIEKINKVKHYKEVFEATNLITYESLEESLCEEIQDRNPKPKLKKRISRF